MGTTQSRFFTCKKNTDINAKFPSFVAFSIGKLPLVKSTNEKKIRKRKKERQLEKNRKTASDQRITVDLAELARKKRKLFFKSQEDLRENERKRDAEENHQENKQMHIEDIQVRKETLTLPHCQGIIIIIFKIIQLQLQVKGAK